VVSLDRTDRAVGVDVLTSPTLVALPFEWAARLYEVIVPAVLTGALEFVQGGRGRVGPGGRALRGDKGDS